TPLAELDYWGTDFSGTAGIVGVDPSTCDPSTGSCTPTGNYYTSVLGPNSYFNRQFHSLYAWRSIGNSNYHALQVSMRLSMSYVQQSDLNYPWSTSCDLTPDSTLVTENGGLATGLGEIINSWSPNQLRGISDFDTAHQLNANWILDLPFGRGKALAGNVH